MTSGDRKRTWGMALTEKLTIFLGPPQVGNPVAPLRPASDDEAQRDTALRTEYRRVVGPDGSVHLEQVVVTD